VTADPRFDVTAVGELMLRLSVPAGERLETASELRLASAGAEGNALAALSSLGRRCALVTALPKGPLGRAALRPLRAAGVDCDGVVWRSEGRIGTYFVEFANPPRPTRVIYDRQDSCAARLTSGDVPWEVLADSRIVHMTGILPALSPSCRRIAEDVRGQAPPVAFDVNYRELLWPVEEARAVLRPLAEDVELLLCSRRDAERIFDCAGSAEEVGRDLAEVTGARAVVVSSGASGAGLWRNGGWTAAPAPAIQIADRLGAGDALAAGVLDGWLAGDLDRGLRQGVTLAAMALTQHGDIVLTSPEELAAVMSASEAAGEVRR
jgi:2-dehydro-3-deoxygluconokinase